MRFNSAKVSLVAGLFSLLLGFTAMAQENIASNMEILREKLAADKKLLIAENLVLTESQAQAFWPIYDDYQTGIQGINQRLAQLILDYAEALQARAVTDDLARTLMNEAISIDEAEVALRKRIAERLNGAVPALEATRYLQIENKIRAVIKFDLAANVPLTE